MNTTPTEETILKTDGLGRVRTPKERREALLDEFERSGLTAQKFAALVGIKYQTFATWAQKRRRSRGAPVQPSKHSAPADSVRWLEAVVQAAQPAGAMAHGLVVELRSGARVEITHAKQVPLAAALLRALQPSC